MQIILNRKKSFNPYLFNKKGTDSILTSPLNANFNENSFEGENDIRTALSHISNKIWIKSIQKINSNSTNMWGNEDETLLVTCLPQGDTVENEALAELVQDAISLRGNLSLIKIVITPTIQVKAVEKVGEDTYEVKPYFAGFIANNEKYRENLLKLNVEDITFELVQISSQSYKPTGKIGTKCLGNEVEFDASNIFHVLAHALNHNEALLKKCADEEVEKVLFKITKDNGVIFNVTSTAAYKMELPKKNIENPNELSEKLSRLQF